MAKTIKFKSVPRNWRKEWLGTKPNTIRTFAETGDIREELLIDFIEERWNLLEIEIENTETMEVFRRNVIDVNLWDGVYTISWEHSHNK